MKNPFQHYPHLHCYLEKSSTEPAVLIESEAICGHVAALGNKEGTFGIPYRTLCLAALHNLVSGYI